MTVTLSGQDIAVATVLTVWVLSCTAICVWLSGRRDGVRENDLLLVHNDRLRVKCRQLHESNARLAAERLELVEFLAVLVPQDFEESA